MPSNTKRYNNAYYARLRERVALMHAQCIREFETDIEAADYIIENLRFKVR